MDTPLVPGYEDTDKEKESFVKPVIQPLIGPFTIFWKPIGRKVEGGKDDDETESIIGPEKQGRTDVKKRF